MDWYLSFHLCRSKSLVHYRRRLRVICEDLALLGMPRSIASILTFWRAGLSDTFWDRILWEVRFETVPFYLTDVQLMYVVEHLSRHFGHVGELTDVEFLASATQPSPYDAPDFELWEDVGSGVALVHDRRAVHVEMMDAIEQGIFVHVIAPRMPPWGDFPIGAMM